MPDTQHPLLIDRPCEGVVRLTLNRPRQRNAINVQMAQELDKALREIAVDGEVRAVLLCAAGDVFSSGHELNRTSALDAEWQEKRATSEGRYAVEQHLYFESGLFLRNLPQPTIAVVQGAAVAAGWTLASLCDLVVASDRAKFQNPMAKMATAGPFLFVEPWDVGIRKAKELLFTADWLSVEDARTHGLVNQIYPHDALEEQALALARRIASMPAWAVRLIKRSFNYTADRMGQRDSWDHQFVVRHLGHASDERARTLARLRTGGTVRSFLNERDGAPGEGGSEGQN